MRGKRFITAYYVVEMVLSTKKSQIDTIILTKYHNHHLSIENPSDSDTIVFGNPITSYIFKKPVELDETILNKLSKKPNLNPHQSKHAAISSALRTWKELSKEDVDILLKQIEYEREQSFLKNTLLSTEEIKEIDEVEVENFIVNTSDFMDKDYKLFKRQFVLSDGSRLDLLYKNEFKKELVVIEIKKGALGKEVYKQICEYIKRIKESFNGYDVRGIIVGSYILPLYEDFYLDKIEKKK